MTTAQIPPDQSTPAAPNATEGGGTVSHYRLEDGVRVIDVSASSVAQLFSGLDPAPFRQRDLDPEVEGYIVAALREIGRPDRAKLVFHLPPDQAASASGHGLADAVHNFFAYRAWVVDQDLKRLRRTGALSFAIGIVFLLVCLTARRVLIELDGALIPGTADEIIAEGLLIIGWVAMWRPLELALYDWWPVWRQRRLYRRLQSLTVECRGTENT